MTISPRPDRPPARLPAVVDVQGLGVTFGRGRGRGRVQALAEVGLTVGLGEFVAVVGPSGCGKSTLLRVLAGLDLPDACVEAERLSLPPEGRRGTRSTAWMPQGDSLLPWRRVMGNLLLGARIARLDPALAGARATALVEAFGLVGFERSWPHELSGGMRQRVALARTCLTGATVLLLDEPFGALDMITRRRLNRWLAEVDLTAGSVASDDARAVGGLGEVEGCGRGASRSVVLVTHDVEEALLLADRVVVMSERPGRVVLDLVVPSGPQPVERARLEIVEALVLGTGTGDTMPTRPGAPEPAQR